MSRVQGCTEAIAALALTREYLPYTLHSLLLTLPPHIPGKANTNSLLSRPGFSSGVNLK